MARPKLCRTSPPTPSTPSWKAPASATQNRFRPPPQPLRLVAPTNAMEVATRRIRFLAATRFLVTALLFAAGAQYVSAGPAADNPGEALKRQFESAKSALAAGSLAHAEDAHPLTIRV